MTQQRHIIKQQILDLQIGSDLPAFELQNQISALYRSHIIPLIERYCDQLSHPDRIDRIDRIEINLGEIALETLEADFVDKVAAALRTELSQRFVAVPSPLQHQEPPSGRILPPIAPLNPAPISHSVEAHFELLQTFLQTGRLPWWCEPLNPHTLEERFNQLLTASPERLKALLTQSLKSDVVMKRLLYQFSDAMRMALLKLMLPQGYPVIRVYLNDLQTLMPHVSLWQESSPARLTQILWQGILIHLALNPSSPPSPATLLLNALWHLAAELHLEGSVLVQHLLTTTTRLVQSGVTLSSDLPQHLASRLQSPVAPPPVTATGRDTALLSLIEQLRLQLTQFAQLQTETQRTFPLRSKLDALLHQLQELIHSQQSASSALGRLGSTGAIALLANLMTDLEESWPTASATEQSLIAQIQTLGRAIICDRRFNPTPTQTPRDFPSLGFSPQDEAIYIQNSGLVLLWPFLARLWVSLGLVESGQFLSSLATHRAVLLLQYLVDASVESLESNLPLNKLLCGLDLADPVPVHLEIPTHEQAECETMLTAIIHNWSALKTTSISGLRQAFLQRSGILRPHPSGWLLQVERQTYDVLLDQIPWNIRVIKLPWMASVLHTEW